MIIILRISYSSADWTDGLNAEDMLIIIINMQIVK